MIKKIQVLLLLLFIFSLPLAAQHAHVELSYQSFRPFVHFQLNFDSHEYGYHNSYESAYLKGYMDGVNNNYYYRHRFDDLVWYINAYEVGYRDGFLDHKLLVRLRGHRWYKRHRFAYNDYSYSVRIWLDGLSLAFLQAPAYRLPRRWKHRAHPHVIRYRKWMAKRHHHKDYDDYYSSANVERRFKKRIKRYRREAHSVKQRYRKSASYDRDQRSTHRYRQNRVFKSTKSKRIKRPKVQRRKVRSIQKHQRQRREVIRKSKKRDSKRSTVKRKRGSKKSKSKRGRSRGKSDRGS